ncbi:MAG: hypothetical protein AAGI08_16110 [Bacteroidota bacterium]
MTAPTLGAGSFEGAVRFTPAVLAEADGLRLVELSIYVLQVPDQATIKVYGPGSAVAPGNLLFSADVTDQLRAESWNALAVDGVTIDAGQDLWAAFAYEDDNPSAVIGCDPGPAVQDGDWVQLPSRPWQPLSVATDLSINWNIRGIAE